MGRKKKDKGSSVIISSPQYIILRNKSSLDLIIFSIFTLFNTVFGFLYYNGKCFIIKVSGGEQFEHTQPEALVYILMRL